MILKILINISAIEYWKSNADKFPTIFDLFKRISADKVEKIIFLNENLNQF